MKKSGVTFLLFLLALTSFGWGSTGHRVTGWIAEKYLCKKAKKEVDSHPERAVLGDGQ